MSSTTLWMGDVEPYWDENFVRSAFTSNGETPVAVKMMKNRTSGIDHHTGQPFSDRGQARYCFVDFPNPASAERVIMNLNGKPVPNSSPPRLFKLNYAVYGMQAPPKAPGAGGGLGERPTGPGGFSGKKEYSLFIGELTPEVDDYALYNFFSRRYPSIKGAKVILDSSGISRGFGFVRFSSEEEQQAALNDMHAAQGLGGRALKVSVATPKKPKQQGPGGEGIDTWNSGVGSWPSGGGGGGTGGNTWNAESGSTWNSGGGGGGSVGSWNSGGGGGGSQWNSGGGQWDSSSQGWVGSQGSTWDSGTWGGAGQQPASWGGSSAAAGSGGAQQSNWGGSGSSQQAGWGGNQENWGNNSQQGGWGGSQQQYGQYQGYQQGQY